MLKSPVKRKLTTILYADIVGYSRLTHQDEVGTHLRVMGFLDYASEAISNGGGTVLRYTGDAILAEFSSVIAATHTAIAVQKDLSTRDSDKPENEKVQIRIGLNLGEVMLDQGEIYGEGVNLAARLEAAT
jgi:adenylate cyclase